MRYKITLSYDGASFCGWQIQVHSPSVQQKLEEALSTLLGAETKVCGAGRTDTGVNAQNYVAHFDYDGSLDTGLLKYKLNAILPYSIAIHSIEEVDESFHARFSATRREYTYHIHREKDPFAQKYSYHCGYPELDFEAMNRAANMLLGTRDFSCFEKVGADNKSSICTVFEAYWIKDDPTHWSFHIAANRFLRNMVRAIVGTLLEVGRGKRSPESIKELLNSGRRGDAGESVPGHALFLTKVEYD